MEGPVDNAGASDYGSARVASPTWDAKVPCHLLFEFNPQLGYQRRSLRPHFVTAVMTSGNLADSI